MKDSEFSNGRCFGLRCIHYIPMDSNGFVGCDVLCDADEVRVVDDLVDNLELNPCEKFIDKCTVNWDM